jgi:hypothetical protein
MALSLSPRPSRQNLKYLPHGHLAIRDLSRIFLNGDAVKMTGVASAFLATSIRPQG